MNSNERLNLRAMMEKVDDQTSPMTALQKARLASQLTQTLKNFIPVESLIVSIYNHKNNTQGPAMKLEQMIAQVAQTFGAKEADKFGRKDAAALFDTPAGAVTVSMDQQRSRAGWGGMETKVKTQIKLDGKVIAKAALLEALGETSKARENPTLKAAFMARAPELAAEWADYIRATYAQISAKFPDGVVPFSIPANSPHWNAITGALRDGCLYVPGDARGTVKAKLVLDEDTLTTRAKAYGEQAALDWFYKTNLKLGDVSSVEMGKPGADMRVTAERDGRHITLDQQRIINCSPKGKLFHQFPSRLYVDSKFMPEAAYKRLFA